MYGTGCSFWGFQGSNVVSAGSWRAKHFSDRRKRRGRYTMPPSQVRTTTAGRGWQLKSLKGEGGEGEGRYAGDRIHSRSTGTGRISR